MSTKPMVKTFKRFVLESLDLDDKLRLVSLGLGDGLTWQVLTCEEDSRPDNGKPYLMCKYYSGWPDDAMMADDSWILPLDGEYSASDAGQKLAVMLKVARVWNADLLWDKSTGEWYSAQTGEPLGLELDKILDLGQP